MSENDPNIIKIQDTSNIYKSDLTALEKLDGFSITGQSQKLRERMLTDQFILNNIAIMGQWTNIYGAPNSGKTLITNWLLRTLILSEEIDGEKIYYVNADDTFRGNVEKAELAENWGMKMLYPGENDFTVGQLPDLMVELTVTKTARGRVLILDTLKKFTQLMDKRIASEFGILARSFISAGGTLICLAHTNKHVGADGKRIYSGTSDIVDDSDCNFVIDKISKEERNGIETHTVEFTNIKARGDVSSKVGFTYEKEIGQPYSALLDTVKCLDKNGITQIKKKANIEAELDEDSEIIITIQELIENGTVTKDKIIKGVHYQTGESTTRIRKVIAKWTGGNYNLGHRWTQHKEAHNRHVYAVLPTPS